MGPARKPEFLLFCERARNFWPIKRFDSEFCPLFYGLFTEMNTHYVNNAVNVSALCDFENWERWGGVLKTRRGAARGMGARKGGLRNGEVEKKERGTCQGACREA